MKKWVFILAAVMLMLAGMTSASEAENAPKPEILAIYSSPGDQILTGEDDIDDIVSTVLYLYKDFTYSQHGIHDGRCETYSTGRFHINFDWDKAGQDSGKPHIMTLHVKKLHNDDHQLKDVKLSYNVDLDRLSDYCLYSDTGSGPKLTAAFMQADKQLLVRRDGSRTYLPTMWLYYDDGSFKQYALDDKKDILFSKGDYTLTGGKFGDEGVVLTIHRTGKYQDGTGMAAYNSRHDYKVNSLGFIRIYP